MLAYNFRKRFVPAIIEGRKTQTIRGERQRHAHEGEPIQLYTGQRTKYCRLIGTATCVAVTPIFIGRRMVTYQDWILTDPHDLDSFAVSDGFSGWAEMRAFWHEHPRDPLLAEALLSGGTVGVVTSFDMQAGFHGVMVIWEGFCASCA